MTSYYVICELGNDHGRVLLGTLHKDRLTMSEIRRFANSPIQTKDTLQWNIPQIYHEVLDGLRSAGTYDEPVDSITCTSESADYLLFSEDGTLQGPTYHHRDPRFAGAMREVLSKVPWETVYQETGIPQDPGNALFQLGAEAPRRLKQAAHILPLADAFNFLLSGVARAELSLAGAAQLCNPVTKTWSEPLIHALRVPTKLFPPLVASGTELAALRPELVKETRLEEARIVAACSHELAAALAGLPLCEGEDWAFLRPGNSTLIGTQLAEPAINEISREWQFANEIGFGGSVCFYKRAIGLSLLEDCRRYWKTTDRDLDNELLGHLAGSAPPFESLINPTEERFLTPRDMPLKIQAFCKETGQTVPRKPGPIYRCILESLALLYRKLLCDLDYLGNRRTARVFILNGERNTLLSHFTANAMQVPVSIASPDTAGIGNAIIQAVALGHIRTLDQAREVIRTSFKPETITPHSNNWDAPYERFLDLFPQPEDPEASEIPQGPETPQSA